MCGGCGSFHFHRIVKILWHGKNLLFLLDVCQVKQAMSERERERLKPQCHYKLKWFLSRTLAPNVELYLSDFHLHMLCVFWFVEENGRIKYVYTSHAFDGIWHRLTHTYTSRTLYFLTLRVKITYVLIYLHLIWIYGINGSYVNGWNEG